MYGSMPRLIFLPPDHLGGAASTRQSDLNVGVAPTLPSVRSSADRRNRRIMHLADLALGLAQNKV
jgi:hypothetical protein